MQSFYYSTMSSTLYWACYYVQKTTVMSNRIMSTLNSAKLFIYHTAYIAKIACRLQWIRKSSILTDVNFHLIIHKNRCSQRNLNFFIIFKVTN